MVAVAVCCLHLDSFFCVGPSASVVARVTSSPSAGPSLLPACLHPPAIHPLQGVNSSGGGRALAAACTAPRAGLPSALCPSDHIPLAVLLRARRQEQEPEVEQADEGESEGGPGGGVDCAGRWGSGSLGPAASGSVSVSVMGSTVSLPDMERARSPGPPRG